MRRYGETETQSESQAARRALPPLGAALAVVAALVLSAPCQAQAAATTAVQAREAAAGWMQAARSRRARLGRRRIRRVTPYRDAHGTVLYHVLDLDPQGYVVVAGDDRIHPVIAFSARGRYVAGACHPLHALAQNDLRQRLQAVRDRKSVV